MPIDASRNPYDSPRFDAPGTKAVRPDSVGKDDVDDELDDALDDLGASTKVAAGAAAGAASGIDDDADDLDGGDLDADLDLAGTGSKGELALDDALDPGVKSLGAELGDDDAFDEGLTGLKGDPTEAFDEGDDLDDPDDLDDDGGIFGADLGEVPDVTATKGAFDDDDLLDPNEKGSIIDAVADAMRAEAADDDDLDIDL